MAGFSGDSPSAFSCIVKGEKKNRNVAATFEAEYTSFTHAYSLVWQVMDFFPLILAVFFASKIYLVYSVIFYHKILLFSGSLIQVSGLICFLIRNQGYQGQLTSVKFKSLQFPADHLQVIQRFGSVLAMSFLFSLLLHVHRSQFLSFTTSPTPPPPSVHEDVR